MFNALAMFDSPTQWIIVVAILLLLFGGSRIPELMKGLGEGMREFKKSMNEEPKSEEKAEEKKPDTASK
ncbi:MAG: twin-arginine translocase TatA/TatE family subunit [Armatimonadetes bacterium]|nr:twin-arginine translocase TatA/TatE family subunit [Armatimonadota bacterium]